MNDSAPRLFIILLAATGIFLSTTTTGFSGNSESAIHMESSRLVVCIPSPVVSMDPTSYRR